MESPQIVLLLLILSSFNPTLCFKFSTRHGQLNRESNAHSHVPEIWLKNYTVSEGEPKYVSADPGFRTQSIFHDSFISKNQSDFTLSALDVEIVVFACRAPYPVAWTAPFPHQVKTLGPFLTEITTLRASLNTSSEEPITDFYETILELWTDEDIFLSANFTCKSLVSIDKQSSIYLFQRGLKAIERQGEVIQVPVFQNEPIMLPCRPAAPDLPVLLEKQAPNLTFVEFAASAQLFSYDPKVGFKLSGPLLENELSGLFRCRVLETVPGNQSEDSFVYLMLIGQSLNHSVPMKGTNANDFQSYLRKQGNATAFLFTDSDDDQYVMCCSGQPKVYPQIVSDYCYQPQCEIAKNIFLEKLKGITTTKQSLYYASVAKDLLPDRQDCSAEDIYRTSLLHCRSPNLEFQEHFVSVFHPNIQNVELRSQKNSSGPLMHFHAASDVVNLPLDRKIFISLGTTKAPNNTTGTNNADDEDEDFAVHFWGWSPTSLGSSSDTKIHEFNRNHYFEGEMITFTCLALRHLYSFGLQLRFKWRNGTSTVVHKASYHEVYVHFNGNARLTNGMTGDPVVYSFSDPVAAHIDMESVECYAPQWNTTKWDVLKHDLEIRPKQ